jgi:hypothetical protein
MNRTPSALPLAAPVKALRTAIVAEPIRRRRVRLALAVMVWAARRDASFTLVR